MAQRFDGGSAPVACDPTLHAAPSHPQPLGDLADRTTCVDFQQRQNAPKEGGIMSPS
jgi:hypothetical protein